MATKRLQYFDWFLFAAVAILGLIGLMMIYSTSLSGAGDGLWMKQLLALAVGLAGLFFFADLNYRFLQKNASWLHVSAMLLLTLVLLIGPEIRGSQRWLVLGPLNFQPVEFAKLSLLVLLARFFALQGGLVQQFRYVLWSALYVAGPVILVALEPDLGSAGLLLLLWLGMLLVSPMPRRYFFYLLVLFLVLAALAWQVFLADYQKDRVLSFLDPTADPLGRDYNVIQSIVAVGSGGLFGHGLARGGQSQLQFLPERQTDFIFASTVEELGLLGGVLVLLLLFFLLFRMIKIVREARDLFGTYLSAGIFFLIFSQITINVGMNLGLLPVTGITLPFLSYGGSSLVIMLWLVGIMENIARNSVPVRFG